MKGTATYEHALAEADPARHAVYLDVRGRDDRCDRCRMADRCPSAWMGALDCPDLDHLLEEGT